MGYACRHAVHAGPAPGDLDEQEVTFLEDMYQLLQAAHFRVLSGEEWETAKEESFTVGWHGHLFLSLHLAASAGACCA